MHTKEIALQERAHLAYSQIPGMEEVYCASPDRIFEISQKFPDAYFATQVAANLFQHDRELSLIHQTAFFSILNGENIAQVRQRHNRDIQRYVDRHSWDD